MKNTHVVVLVKQCVWAAVHTLTLNIMHGVKTIKVQSLPVTKLRFLV